MKNIIKYLFVVSAVLSSVSCSFLNVEEKGKSDTDTFFSEMDGLRTARVGLYSVAYDFYNQYFFKYADVAGDELQSAVVGSGSDMYYQYNFLSTPDLDATAVGMLWKKGYVVITNANTILYYADGLKKNYPNDVGEIDKIKAEAYFFRALAHFDLVLCYAQPYGYTSDASHAGIPVATRLLSTKETIARSSVKEVYDQVISDLNTALSILGDGKTTDAHYVSGEACDALLARVYLYKEDYADAVKYADKVISEVTLTSYSDYNAMYTEEKIGSEAIFRLSGYYAGSTLKSFYNYQSPKYYPTDSFLSLFSSDDVRKTLLLDPDGNKACMKYYDMTDNSVDDLYYDISVLRGSEMYLIRAEASCMQDDLKRAASDVRTIRGRALNLAADNVPLVYYTKTDLMNEIKLEYRKELCFEGHRFFDLARWGDDIVRSQDTNSSMKELDYPDHRFALPIPLVEMEANAAMTQNEGY